MDSVKRIIKIIGFFINIIIIGMVAIILVQRFTNNKTAIAGVRVFTVITESMVPKYNVGDVLLVKYKSPNEIMVGEDVAYQGEVADYAGKVITHQVKKIRKKEENGERTFVTRGIAPQVENDDPEIKGSQIYGVVVMKLQIMSYLNKIINNNYGMYFLIVIPLAVIVFTELRGIKKDKEEILEEFDEEEEDERDRYSNRPRNYNDNYSRREYDGRNNKTGRYRRDYEPERYRDNNKRDYEYRRYNYDNDNSRIESDVKRSDNYRSRDNNYDNRRNDDREYRTRNNYNDRYVSREKEYRQDDEYNNRYDRRNNK